MDRTLDVRTPESIEFSYELAGVGSRFLAYFVDLLIQIGFLALFFWGLVLIGAHAPRPRPHETHVLATKIALAFIVAVVFAIFFGYFIVFESLWNGQTPGKKLFGLRVVRDGGYPADWGASTVRNLIRVGELTLGFYALSVLVAILSPQNKRIGDMAAGTIVVREARGERPATLLEELRAAPVYASTAYVSGDERAIVKRFLERRDRLVKERRAALAAQLAERIRPRVPEAMRALDDEELLERL
jgi:uncharacterized RDD family membrane protein YckC